MDEATARPDRRAMDAAETAVAAGTAGDRPLRLRASEWRWGAGSRTEPGEDVVVTDAERRRLRLQYRLEHAVDVAVAALVVVALLIFCISVGLFVYYGGGGPYCCGPG